MNLPYNWDFIQDNIPPEKLAEYEEDSWRSGVLETILKKK
jgi:hypothetical protein